MAWYENAAYVTWDEATGTAHLIGHGWGTEGFGIRDGAYEIGDEISVSPHWDEGPDSITVELVGFSDIGFLAFNPANDTYTFFTSHYGIFEVTSIQTTGTFITCFLTGTMIATPGGERLVEDLAIGDLVLTASGDTRPVRWIGRQTVQRMFADPVRCYPIRISAGALDDNIPVRDLYVSPDHALLVDGLLVQAHALVNGVTITRVERPEERFTYFHIELEDHALVLAEGAPAETFVDNVTRQHFDNYKEFEALYGEEVGLIDEIDLPRVKSVRQLPADIRARLDERTGVAAAVA